jgi:hypothetical protein
MPEGAKDIAIAFEHLKEELPARQILEIVAGNLGMEEIGSSDEETEFRPLEHEDSEGGIAPGDSVSVVHCGWRFGGNVLVRAMVKRV